LATAVLGLCLIWASPALAQKTTLPPSLNTSNPQSAFIKNQLTISTDLARKTLAGLEAMPPDNSIPIDESMLQNARDTYVLIRAARHGIELAKEQSRYPDPVMDLVYKRVTNAWNLARNPVDRSSSAGIPRQQYIQESIQSLNQAIRLVNQAMMLMP
jgi:hypothetical protein